MQGDPVEMIAALIDGKGEGRYGPSGIDQWAHPLQASVAGGTVRLRRGPGRCRVAA